MMTRLAQLHREADGLALAIIASSAMPLLLLDGTLAVVAASKSFCDAFDIDPLSVPGRKLADLGHGEWNLPELRALLAAALAGHAEGSACEIELERLGHPTRRLALDMRRLDHGGRDTIRLTLAITDVTDVRAAERRAADLIHEKTMRLEELQHRVANSLQIVASVLMLSARRAQSEEAQTHLRDAHQRVMSIAAVQRHLATSTRNRVKLRSYLIELCTNLGASMIRDHKQITIEVQVDDSVTTADVSVSLGLIVTELVINALKHAFPGQRRGTITIGYQSRGSAWTLSVADTGVSMSAEAAKPPGLGTGILEALARRLDAGIRTEAGDPGTIVSIEHA